MTIGRKLGLGFGILLCIVTAIGLFSTSRMRQAARVSENLSSEHLPVSALTERMRLGIADARWHGRSYQFTGDQAEYEEALGSLEEIKKAFLTLQPLVHTNAALSGLQDQFKKLPALISAFEETTRQSERTWAELRAARIATTKKASECEMILRGLIARQKKAAAEETATNAPKASIDPRQARLTFLNDVMLTFYNLRIANLRAQALRDAEELEQGLKNCHALIAALEKNTSLFPPSEGLQALDDLKKTLETYRAEMARQATIATRQEEVNAARVQCAADIDAAVRAIAMATAKQTINTAQISTQQLHTSSMVLLGAALLAGVLCIAGAGILTRLISRPIVLAAKLVEQVSHRDLTVKLNVTSSDEVGQIGHALNDMVDGLAQNVRNISSTAQSLAGASKELGGVSSEVNANAEETFSQVGVVSAATAQVGQNIQTVATGADEMTASINEIAKSAAEASRVALHAAQVTEQTNVTVAKLGDSSSEIGEVIKVITSIAHQTNLLALNATIEAARAGEAGKGFAVVANEVKELAKQTATATDEIGTKIGAIQADTQAAVAAIQEVGAIVKQINDIQAVIASAVEEQAATTREISRSASEAAQGSTEISRHINSVSDAAKNTSQDASRTSAAASELARLSAELKSIVDQFKLSRSPSPGASANSNGAAQNGSSNGNGRSTGRPILPTLAAR